jgi:hypothetical protein
MNGKAKTKQVYSASTKEMLMAYPIINSPMFPSVADIPALPPTLEQMPVFNPGQRYYRCEDGVTRLLTEEQAINMGISCSAVGPEMGQARQEFAPGPFSTGPRYKGVTLGDRRVVRRI